MRTIDEKAYNAFMNGERFIGKNTKVIIASNETVCMYLFDNMIACKQRDQIEICSGGYKPSRTTRSRLSMFVNISLHKGKFIINNKIKWDGEWTNINHFN